MADSPSSSSVSTDKPSTATSPEPSLPYAWLRWVIRFTGVLLMFGGTLYLGIGACTLLFGKLTYHKPTDGLYVLVVSLLALGLGYFVFRVGLNMLCSINASTIGSFSFLFALVYTPILMYLLPASSLFHGHSTLMLLLPLLYFGMTYLVLKRILLRLLFPKG